MKSALITGGGGIYAQSQKFSCSGQSLFCDIAPNRKAGFLLKNTHHVVGAKAAHRGQGRDGEVFFQMVVDMGHKSGNPVVQRTGGDIGAGGGEAGPVE